MAALLSAACHVGPPPLERANLLADHGRETEAIGLLEQHLAAHPADVAERRQLIRLYGSVGRIDQASAQTERLAEILPRDSPIPFVELGHAFELSHRFEEALGAYDRASEVAPRDALGLVRVSLGQLEAARQAYVNGLRADPMALENQLGLATVALRMNEPEQALAAYESLLAARPSFAGALLGKSWSLILLGRYEDAEAALARATEHGAPADSVERQRLAIRDRRAQLPQKSRAESAP